MECLFWCDKISTVFNPIGRWYNKAVLFEEIKKRSEMTQGVRNEI